MGCEGISRFPEHVVVVSRPSRESVRLDCDSPVVDDFDALVVVPLSRVSDSPEPPVMHPAKAAAVAPNKFRAVRRCIEKVKYTPGKNLLLSHQPLAIPVNGIYVPSSIIHSQDRMLLREEFE
jgi:hypothetical protein